MKPQDLSGLRVLVVGAAREGTAATRYLLRHGAIVRLADAKPLEALGPDLDALQRAGAAVEGGVAEPSLDGVDVVILSPGVPPHAPLVQEARRRGLPLCSEPRLFTQLFTGLVVGVTGSSGKTTTTSLLGEMFRRAGRRVLVGGNIGVPLLSTLDGPGSTAEVAVMELSSFQLELFSPDYQGEKVDQSRSAASRVVSLSGWSPPVAVVTNITPNHLDRHPSMGDYILAKTQILAHQGSDDWAVLNADDPLGSGLAAQVKGRLATFSLQSAVELGAYAQDERLVLRWDGRERMLCGRQELLLRGEHNVANVLAASCAAAAAGVPVASIREAAISFEGVPHRLEVVRTLNGVSWVNDSIATSPERVVAALKAYQEPLVLLAGGRDKHLPWDEWARWVSRKVRLVIAFGECAPLIEEAVSALEQGAPPVIRADTLDEAVGTALERARCGDVVLLSPGGTSFDAYRDFEARGDVFRQLVRELR